MGKHISRVTEECAANNSINAVYVLQDVLHETRSSYLAGTNAALISASTLSRLQSGLTAMLK